MYSGSMQSQVFQHLADLEILALRDERESCWLNIKTRAAHIARQHHNTGPMPIKRSMKAL